MSKITYLGAAAALCLSLPAMAASTLDGHWVGIFDIGNKPMFLNARFAGPAGSIDMPANEVKDLKLLAIKHSGAKIHFELPGPDGTVQFDGKLTGDTVSGKAVVKGKQGNFTLQRSLVPSPERDEGFMGAYRFADGRLVVLSHLGDFPQLYYVDSASGRYSAVFASDAKNLYSGRAFFDVSKRETNFKFEGTRMTMSSKGSAPVTGERVPVKMEEVSFKNGDVTLSGTVVTPEGPGPFPVVVLTQMSSPAPRSAYALQAYYFAARGIASLMYDKRGVGKSTGDWHKASMQDLADDAVAGIDLVAARKDIDAKRIGTWGHSQGGWLAPLAAVRSGKVSFVIAQAASGVPPAEQEVYRIENTMRADHFGQADIDAAVAYERKLMHWVTSGGAGREELLAAARAGDKAPWANSVEIVPDTLRAVPRPESTAFYSYDPLPDLAKLKAPIVYILGDKDTFVPVHKSAALVKQTLGKAGHTDHEVWMMPKSAHGLWEIETDGANAFVYSRYVSRGMYSRLDAWLRKHGVMP